MPIIAAVIAAAVFAFTGAASAYDGTPKLAIPIPTIKFTDLGGPSAEGGIYHLPWIAEYIAGLYRYSLNLGGVIATVMIVIGGFQYLTAGGDAGRVKAGKQRITDAVIGLLLLVGSYVILNTVNPDLVTLSSVRVLAVKKTFLETAKVMQTTKAVTGAGNPSGADGAGGGSTGGGPPASSGGAPVAGSFTPVYKDCPFELPPLDKKNNKAEPNKNARSLAFFEKIGPLAQGTTPERIQKVADAAAKCGVHFGACGQAGGTIWALAGAGDVGYCVKKGWFGLQKCDNCLFSTYGCWIHEKGKSIRSLNSSQLFRIRTFLCYQDGGETCCWDPKDKSKCMPNKPPGCSNNGSGAISQARDFLEGSIKGYPDSWANDLQPGDAFWVYNGNRSCSSQHTAIFLGWGANGKAQVVQGGWGDTVWAGSICLKKSCGNYTPITSILRPRK